MYKYIYNTKLLMAWNSFMFIRFPWSLSIYNWFFTWRISILLYIRVSFLQILFGCSIKWNHKELKKYKVPSYQEKKLNIKHGFPLIDCTDDSPFFAVLTSFINHTSKYILQLFPHYIHWVSLLLLDLMIMDFKLFKLPNYVWY